MTTTNAAAAADRGGHGRHAVDVRRRTVGPGIDHDAGRDEHVRSPPRSATGTAPASTPGRSHTLSTAGTNRTIGFDRYSFSDPAVGTIDAAAFDEEPLAGWWRTSPFSNVRTQVRTFVLDPDVEVLVLDPAGRASACAGPPPASPPTPTWKPADLDVLEDPAYVGAIATLTYSPTGQVARIRFTQGC